MPESGAERPAPSSTALLVLHLQNWVVNIPGYAGERSDRVLERAAAAAAAARAHGIPVIFVQIAFRRNGADVSPRNPLYARMPPDLGNFEDDPGAAFDDRLTPEPGDVVVSNKRISAFTGGDLDVVLRSLGATHLVLCGIGTGGVVLSTFRAAADLDFELTVLVDACADSDDDIHRVCCEKIFPRQGEVVTVDEWIAEPGYTLDRVGRAPLAR